MSDSEWSEELEPAPEPKKRSLGKWIAWGCGCGCLAFVLVGIILGVIGFRAFQKGSDGDVQWPKVATHLAFDERPEGITVFGLDLWGFEQYYFLAEDDEVMAILMVFEPDISVEQALGQAGPMRSTVEREVVELQGREVEVMWHETKFDVAQWFGMEEAATSRTLAIDLSDERHTVLLQVQRLDGELELSHVQEFLAPFDLWRDR